MPAPQGLEPGTEGGRVAHLGVVRQLRAGGAQLLVRVVGEIDLVTASALATALDYTRGNAGTSQEVTEIVVDLRPVRFLSAAGMWELVRAQRRCQHDGIVLRVVADQRPVTRPLRLTGLDRSLGLRPNLDAARDIRPDIPVSAGVVAAVPDRNATTVGAAPTRTNLPR